MSKKVINMPGTSQHPFSSAVRAGDFIFLSGQGGAFDDKKSELKTIEAQTKQCLENMEKVLEFAGSSLNDVVKVTIFLNDSANFKKMNDVYRKYFSENMPARSTAITGLAVPGMMIEMECIAYSPLIKN
ncbi:MAG: RidA family protein [Chloroflexi bacterium]|nr:RidA family protein [Chloroflexota bacterium]